MVVLGILNSEISNMLMRFIPLLFQMEVMVDNQEVLLLEGEHKTIYIAGDTALTMDMKLIPMQTNTRFSYSTHRR